ncbi:unnamed protein product [Clonostachys rosea]|uniref:Uncharacterized protein n=1 Tax=Bionectria ochroleuca TaxID=29856 RepID=A0ABY6TVS9_BIOOC|nr:unnamed protein product [Clonostachys rosea]
MSSPIENSTKTSFKSSDTFNGRKTAPLQSPSYASLSPSTNFQQALNNDIHTGQIENQHDKATPQLCCLPNSSSSPPSGVAGSAHPISDRVEQSSEDYQSALNTWLMAQNLSLVDSPVMSTDEADCKDFVVPRDSSPSPETQKDSTLEDIPADLSVIAKDVSQDRTSKDPDKMSTISEISLRNTEGTSNVDIDERGQANYKDIPVLAKSSSQDLAESYAAALAFNFQQDNGSSNYNSVRPSFQPSPVRSYLNLHRLDPQDLNSVTWVPFRSHGNESDSTGSINLGRSSSYATAEADFNSDAAERNSLVSRELSQNSAELSSTRISETGSVLVRQIEPAFVKNKFRGTLPRDKPFERLDSRFKEHLRDIDAARAGHLSIPHGTRPKNSEESAPKNYKTTGCRQVISVGACPYRLIGIRKRATEDEMNSTEKLYAAGNPGLKQDAGIPWNEARTSPLHQAATSIDGLNPCQTKTSLERKRKPKKSYAGLLYSPSPRISKAVQTEPGTMDKTSFPSSSRHDAFQGSAHDTSTDTGESTALASRDLGLPPKSWSRYPSHTRHERNELEDIGLRDFAPTLPDRLGTS